MALATSNRDGGRTSESGHLRAIMKGLKAQVMKGLNVTQRGAGANMSVDVQIGDAIIPRSDGTYGHPAWADAIYNVAITTADVSNPRRDIVVMYIDYGQTPSTGVSNNTNGVVKIIVVAGTPAGSPSDPSNAAIQSAVGASNPYIKLARVRVAAGASSITNSVIDDLRLMATGIQQGGWIYDEIYTWSYLSATSFAIADADVTSLFPVGLKLKLNQAGTTKYFVVTSTSFSTNTTVNVSSDGSTTLSNVPIDRPAFSYNERPEGYPYASISNPGQWWQELGRVVASGGPLADMPTLTIPARKYLKIIFVGAAGGGSYAFGFQFNGDTGNNYSDALIYGSGSSAGYSQTASRGNIRSSTTIPSGGSWFLEAELLNFPTINKQFQGHGTSDAGGGINATWSPDNQLFSGKWVNAAQITSIKAIKLGGTSGIANGAELIVLGHD